MVNSTSNPAAVPMLETRHARMAFDLPSPLFKPRRSHDAVKDVSLQVMKGETFAIVGESGSGKTTLARMMLGLLQPTGGDILLQGQPIAARGRIETARIVQPIFQDPYSSLNPHKTIESIISLPLRVHRIGNVHEQQRMVREMMDAVGLPARMANRYASQLSGGQRQRVAIARALIARPALIVCDEPTSALDVSVQSQILNLLQDLQRQLELTYVLITHNLAVVEHLADRVAVMYRGEVVEETQATALFARPRHPYTRSLLNSALTPEPGLGIPTALEWQPT